MKKYTWFRKPVTLSASKANDLYNTLLRAHTVAKVEYWNERYDYEESQEKDSPVLANIHKRKVLRAFENMERLRRARLRLVSLPAR